VVGGLLTSQVLTLYLTPVIYLYFDQLQQRLRQRRGRAPSPAPSTPPQLGSIAHE
jgi:hypothetical protein